MRQRRLAGKVGNDFVRGREVLPPEKIEDHAAGEIAQGEKEKPEPKNHRSRSPQYPHPSCRSTIFRASEPRAARSSGAGKRREARTSPMLSLISGRFIREAGRSRNDPIKSPLPRAALSVFWHPAKGTTKTALEKGNTKPPQQIFRIANTDSSSWQRLWGQGNGCRMLRWISIWTLRAPGKDSWL